jgi:hypothetical protein
VKPYLLLAAGLLLFAPDAGAQVFINQAALDQLAGIVPGAAAQSGNHPPPVIRQRVRKIAYRRVLPRRIRAPHLAGAAVIAKPAPPSAAPVPKPAVQPVVARPAPPPVPKPAFIDFAAGDADLPGNGADTLRPFCTHSGGVIIIDAYAAADPSDPSSAPRLSMSRAFAIRDALTACGIPSSSIIPRADGAARVENPDAAEISVSP